MTTSPEHTEFRWTSYEDAVALLEQDSNKVALLELSQRLANETLPRPI